MSNMPERIWANPALNGGFYSDTKAELETGTGYVRADLVAAQIQAAVQAERDRGYALLDKRSFGKSWRAEALAIADDIMKGGDA